MINLTFQHPFRLLLIMVLAVLFSSCTLRENRIDYASEIETLGLGASMDKVVEAFGKPSEVLKINEEETHLEFLRNPDEIQREKSRDVGGIIVYFHDGEVIGWRLISVTIH